MIEPAPLTMSQLAERWDCSRRTIERMMADGRLRGFRLGGKRAFRAMTNVTLEQKVAEQRRIKRMEDERRQLKLSLDAEIQRISDDKDRQLDEIARLLAIRPTVTPLMTIRWEMA